VISSISGVFLTRILTIVIVSLAINNSSGQSAVYFSGIFGHEKAYPALNFEYSFDNGFFLGGGFGGGYMSNYEYPKPGRSTTWLGNPTIITISTPYESEYDFYSPISAHSKISGWTSCIMVGSKIPSISFKQFDTYFRILFSFSQLQDRYSVLTFAGIYEGNYKFKDIGIISSFGIKRVFGRLFSNANISLGYYTSINDSNSKFRYGSTSPFVGVEFEMNLGIGYSFN